MARQTGNDFQVHFTLKRDRPYDAEIIKRLEALPDRTRKAYICMLILGQGQFPVVAAPQTPVYVEPRRDDPDGPLEGQMTVEDFDAGYIDTEPASAEEPPTAAADESGADGDEISDDILASIAGWNG